MDDTTKSDLEKKIEEFKTTNDMTVKANLGIDIGYQLVSIGQHEEGAFYCLETLKIAEAINNHKVAFNCYSILGRMHNIRNENLQSKGCHEKALVFAEKSKDNFCMAMAYNNIGACEREQRNFHGAIDNYIKAANTIGQSDINNDFLETLYINLGNAFKSLKINLDALEYFRKAIKLKTTGDKGYLYYSLGMFHIDQTKDFALALGYLKRSLKISIDKNDIGEVYLIIFAICDVYFQQKKYVKALDTLNESIKYEIDSEMSELITLAWYRYGKIYLALEDYQKSKEYFDKVLEDLDSIFDYDLMNIYECLKELYFKTGNYLEAYQYSEKYIELKDKIADDEKMRITVYEATKFETEQKKKDLEIYRLKNVELAKSQRIIEEKNEELIKTNEMKDNILGMIAHDLKNYIGSTISAHELLIMKEKDIADNKFIKMINDSCQKALALVKDILYMNKMEVDESSLVLEKLSLTETIDYLMDNLRLLAKKKNIEIITDFPTEPLFCNLNTDKFHRVIDNLVINAIKFTPTDGKIIVKVQKIEDKAHISIIDSGIGMDEEIRAKLFKQYSKAGRKGTEGEESTGLGLYIVNTILDKHQATIEVFSEVNKGSEFLIKMMSAL